MNTNTTMETKHLTTAPNTNAVVRNVIVTGRSSGIGFATAYRFLSDPNVVIIDRNVMTKTSKKMLNEWKHGSTNNHSILTLVFGGCAFPPVSLGPAGDCPCRD
jgi:thermostable 8-oxoguanine DNA glycosylase